MREIISEKKISSVERANFGYPPNCNIVTIIKLPSAANGSLIFMCKGNDLYTDVHDTGITVGQDLQSYEESLVWRHNEQRLRPDTNLIRIGINPSRWLLITMPFSSSTEKCASSSRKFSSLNKRSIFSL